MEIKPTYVTFEQAKLLKGKGFDGECNKCYFKQNAKIFGIDEHGRYYKSVNIPKKLHTVGDVAVQNIENVILAPEQWLVVEWLRVNHGIWIDVGVGNLFHKCKFYILIKTYNVDRWDLTSLDNERHSPYDTPQKAYSAAFDYILKKLI
jgi:hypothetical protein